MNMQKNMLGALGGVSDDTMQQIQNQVKDQLQLQKAITTSQGLVGYNLEAPAKQLVPMMSPMRNRIPRKVSKTGVAANWKVITDIRNGRPTTTEGARGNLVDYSTENKSADFKILSLGDNVSFEAQAGGRDFQDVRAMAGTNLLLKLMMNEEIYDIGGNITAINNPTNVTASAGGTGGTIPTNTYNVYVAALTIPGMNTATMLDSQINNLFIDNTYGVTMAVAGTPVGVTLGQKLTIGCTRVHGAYAYAMFAGTGTAATLQVISSTNSFTLDKVVAGGLSYDAITTNSTADALAYDGILPQILAGNGFVLDGNNAKLTALNGGVAELDELNAYAWGRYKIGYTRYICGAGMQESITSAIMGSTAAPLLFTNKEEVNQIRGNQLVTQYVNRAMGGKVIEIEAHPYLPNSCLIALPEVIPYPNNEVTSLLEKECGYDYMQFDYAMTLPRYEFEVRMWGALKNYFPAACGVLVNFAKGV